VLVRESQRAAALVLLGACGLLRVPLIVYGHLQPRHVRGARAALRLRLLRRLGAHVATTVAPDVQPSTGPPLGFLPPVVASASPARLDTSTLRVVCVGRYARRKNQRWVVEAVGRLQTSGVDVDLTMIGSGSRDVEASIRALARERLRDGSMHFIGNLPNAEVL
jgi:glycosyltransferase involved in cell wall biosynthesis